MEFILLIVEVGFKESLIYIEGEEPLKEIEKRCPRLLQMGMDRKTLC